MKLCKVVLVLVALVLSVLIGILIPQVVFAAPLFDEGLPPVGDVPALVDVLKRIAEAGGTAFVVAFLFERISWFQNLSKEAKWWTIFLLSVFLPVIAQLLLQFVPAEVWVRLEPYWRSIATGFLTWAGTQAVHLVHKALARRGRSFELLGKN